MKPSDSAADVADATAATPRRVLVTGLAGFTGRHLAAHLAARGARIWGTVAPEASAIDDALAPCAVTAVDLLDADGLARCVAAARPEAVVHLAGAAHAANGDAGRTYQVNVVGTRNLLAALAALDTPPRCVLLASSANIYGNAPAAAGGEPLDEQIVPQPANDYAVSKLAMEYMARLWRERLPVVVARPFNYTGVGQSEDYLLPKIVGHYARRARTISLGNLDVSRDFSDVRDVVAAYGRLLDVAPAGEVFNVCSGRGYSLGDVLRLLGEIAGYEIEVKVDPRFVRANEVRRLVGSDAKLRGAIGARTPIGLGETLEWMYEAARKAL